MSAPLSFPPQATELAGSRALVTGATTGLGRAVAATLAERGCHVLVHGRNEGRGADVVADIQERGGRATFVMADIADSAQVSALIDTIGDIDILVNNAGGSAWGPTQSFPIEQLDRMYATHVRAPFLLVAATAPAMAGRGAGSIISIGSMSASVGLVNGAAYGATKAGIVSLSQSWAAEYGPSGVRVNVVAPGPVYTRPEAEAVFTRMGATTPLGRAAQPQEIAEAVAFLASPRAAYITGAVVAVDGGRTAI